ncbi:hypothetical protein [Methanolobus sp. ZRKC5]|uniref:hypothetical protein n=1 Tax=unclassified Methanolobus TaxID=2629569 RepID=UPI00313DF8F6
MILSFEPKSERKEKIKIKTGGDVDFSEYVEELTYLIAEKPKLIFDSCDTDDSKFTLVQDTISDIVKSFNESIDGEDEQIGDENSFND